MLFDLIQFNAHLISEAATRGVLWKQIFLEILHNSEENTCVRVSFLQLIKTLLKRDLRHVLSSEICKISKKAYFKEHLWTYASLICVLWQGENALQKQPPKVFCKKMCF